MFLITVDKGSRIKDARQSHHCMDSLLTEEGVYDDSIEILVLDLCALCSS